jgi:hypothetical protein
MSLLKAVSPHFAPYEQILRTLAHRPEGKYFNFYRFSRNDLQAAGGRRQAAD